MNLETKYGLIAGGAVCLWIILEYLLGFHTTRIGVGEYADCLGYALPAGPLYLLLRRTRDDAPDGRLPLGRAVLRGLRASFIASVIVYGFLIAYHYFINPEWIDHILEWRVARLRAADIPEGDIRREILAFRALHEPVGLVLTTVLGLSALGGMYAFAIALFLRRPPPASR